MNRSSVMRWVWVLLSGAVLAGPVAAAEIYKWVDEEGVTHYTQEPPPSSQASQVDVIGPSKEEVQREQREMQETGAELEAAREQRRESEQEAAKAKQQADRRREQCARLRESVEELSNQRRLLVPDGEGGVRRLSEEERKERLAERRVEMDKHCD